MQTENTYVETDLGNIAFNPRGEYSDETSYEYLDTVSYKGGSYVCLAELAKTTSGIAPEPGKNTEHWQMLTLPGGLTSDYIAMHDDVVNKAKQIETSRAAVELSQQEVEAAQADVRQMRQDTQEASQAAIASRDSAAGYAQSAEASRTAAKESEDNINAQVVGFDTHVAEKESEAETAITEARRAAVSTVSTKQDDATQAVTDEGNKQIKNVEDAGTEQVGKVKSAGASAVSTAGAAGVSAVNAVKTQQTASIKVVADKGTQQVTAVNTAGSTQASIIETKGADQVKAIQEAGENALQNISDGVDKGLSEEGKAADAKATGEAISKLTEDLSNKITKFYASNQGETHLADSDNGKIQDMMLYGKSSQFTTTGKNLANGQNINCFINSVADTCGISSNDIGMVIDVSKLTNVSISTRSIQDRYRFACANTVPTKENSITCYNGTNKDGTKDSYTMDTTGYNYLFINATKLEDIQAEKGSESTSYEPYTGGIPSPSPDYPQEIKSVVNPTVKVCGKNLLQPNIKLKDRVKINIKKGTRLTLICKNGVVSQGGNLRFITADGGMEWFGFDAGAVKQQTVLKNNVVSFEYLFSYEPSESYALYIGDENTYEPYKEQSVQLPYTLNAIPVSSGGNVTINGQQYVADYVDVERGKVVRRVDSSKLDNTQSIIDKTEWLLAEQQETDLTTEQTQALKELVTYYPVTNISVNSEQLDGYTVFNYPISMANGWNYVKQQLNDNRDYIYDIDTQSAEAYVNSEYAVALAELEG